MTEDNAVWWIASIIVGAGSVPAGLLLVLAWERLKKMLRPSNGPHIIVWCSGADLRTAFDVAHEGVKAPFQVAGATVPAGDYGSPQAQDNQRET